MLETVRIFSIHRSLIDNYYYAIMMSSDEREELECAVLRRKGSARIDVVVPLYMVPKPGKGSLFRLLDGTTTLLSINTLERAERHVTRIVAHHGRTLPKKACAWRSQGVDYQDRA